MFKKRQLRFCNKKASSLDDNILRDFGKQLKFKFNYNFEQNEYKTLNNSFLVQFFKRLLDKLINDLLDNNLCDNMTRVTIIIYISYTF